MEIRAKSRKASGRGCTWKPARAFSSGVSEDGDVPGLEPILADVVRLGIIGIVRRAIPVVPIPASALIWLRDHREGTHYDGRMIK